MINKKTAAYRSAWMYFNTGEKAGNMGNKPGRKTKAAHPEPVCEPVQPHRVQSWVTEKNLGQPTGGRILFENRSYILKKTHL